MSELSRRNMLRGAMLGAVSLPVAAQAAQSVAPQPEPIPVPTMTPKERIAYHAECLRAAVKEDGATRIGVAIDRDFVLVHWTEPKGVEAET